jgi:hypothetical protein
MSKSSAKEQLTTLLEWMTTLKSKRSKPVKSNNIQPKFTDYNIKIKNGPNARR